MKKLLTILFLSPIGLFSQYLTFPTTYDSESAAKKICSGEIKNFLSDTVEWKVEKKNDRWVTSWIDKDEVSSKLHKILSKGSPEYSGRTNAGYWFYIAVIDVKDETKMLQTVKFEVDHMTQKIVVIEIQRNEK